MAKDRTSRPQQEQHRSPVLKVIIQRVGSVSALARALGISVAAVSGWREVPPDRVLQVEELTGVSRHIQRPDVFGVAAGGEPPSGVAEGKEKKSHSPPAAA